MIRDIVNNWCDSHVTLHFQKPYLVYDKYPSRISKSLSGAQPEIIAILLSLSRKYCHLSHRCLFQN
jgi:hypothetical protein